MDKRPIIALDFASKQNCEQFLLQFKDTPLNVKVGMELFYKEGPSLLEWLKEHHHSIFLDLKLHDIPNTVYHAMKNLALLGVDMVNVHAAGGREMMRAALQGLEEGTPNAQKRPLLIAVTQLTSTSEEQMKVDQLISVSLQECVLHYAKLAYESGLDGVVCSALEANDISKATQSQFLKVTPGIRMTGDHVNDQKRVVTPGEAKKIGSSHIVVGRSITKAKYPVDAYERLLKEWEL